MSLLDLTIAELTAGYAARRFSPVEVTHALLHALGSEAGRRGNAFVSLDTDGALAMARVAERRYRSGVPLGPLDGVPVSIKDMIDVQGWPTRRGSHATEGSPPAPADAPVVALLRAAGAPLLGKTTTAEFGWAPVSDAPLTGVTPHPLNPSRTTGGSSAGAAAHLAAGLGRLAIGSDAGGSVRIPASWCGLVGFKPTHGAVPQAPLSALGDFSHIGPLSRCVDDSIAAMAVLSAPDLRDPASLFPRGPQPVSATTLRIGWSAQAGHRTATDPAIAQALQRLASRLCDEPDLSIEPVDLSWLELGEALWPLWTTRVHELLSPLPAERRERLDPRVLALAGQGRAQPLQAVIDSRRHLRQVTARLTDLFIGLDVLLTPTTPSVALPHGRLAPAGHALEAAIQDSGNFFAAQPFSVAFNLTQQPALSLPLGTDAAGLPFGVQLAGRKYDDDRLLRFARRVEAMCRDD